MAMSIPDDVDSTRELMLSPDAPVKCMGRRPHRRCETGGPPILEGKRCRVAAVARAYVQTQRVNK